MRNRFISIFSNLVRDYIFYIILHGHLSPGGGFQGGVLTLEKLEAMTCVCSVGLDMIAIPGDTPASTISGLIADEMAIGMINCKTTAVRVIPVPGKTVGDKAVFGGLLGEAAIIRVPGGDSAGFVKLGGRIPAPIHSLKN